MDKALILWHLFRVAQWMNKIVLIMIGHTDQNEVNFLTILSGTEDWRSLATSKEHKVVRKYTARPEEVKRHPAEGQDLKYKCYTMNYHYRVLSVGVR
jgi:hypothetical protein